MNLKTHAQNLVNTVFGLGSGERFLILSELYDERYAKTEADRVRWQKLNVFTRELAEAVQQICPQTSLYEYPSTGGHGMHPEKAAWEKLFGRELIGQFEEEGLMDAILAKTYTKEQEQRVYEIASGHDRTECDAVMALTNFSTSHTLFRKLFTDRLMGRYASMPAFDADMFNSGMTADWAELGTFTTRLAAYLQQFDAFHITSENGTDLTIVRNGRRVEPDTGNLRSPGSFHNLPSGEAYFAPMEGESNGTLVIEYAPQRKLAAPLTLTIKNGELVSIEGDEPYAEEMRAKIAQHPNNKNVAEMGVGSNPAAVKLDNILESEKIYGTVHIAFGDNRSFGGAVTAPFHEDYLITKPEVYGIQDGKKTLVIKERIFYIV